MRAARLLSWSRCWSLPSLLFCSLLLYSFGCSLATDLNTLSSEAGRRDGAALDLAGAESNAGEGHPTEDSGVLATTADGGTITGDAFQTDAPGSSDMGQNSSQDALQDRSPAASEAGSHDGPDDGTGGSVDAVATGTADALSPDSGADALTMCRSTPVRSATLELFSGIPATTGCGYPRASLPRYVAAVDTTTFAAAGACGACMRIETAAAVVEAEVVEQGPGKTPANATTVAVNMAALALLVPDGSTYVDQGVEWRFVPCSLPEGAGMTFLFQPGSNASYSALLIQNHRFAIEAVEYRISGVYRRLTHTSYNNWVASSGMGGGPFTLRITDVFGHVVEQEGIPLAAGVSFRGNAQFPACRSDN